jgi:predicted SAM-dependent methyltransferase
MSAGSGEFSGESARRISFGNACPDGYICAPEASVDNLQWQNSWDLESLESLYVEHELTYRTLHQVRDFLVACYNVLTPGGYLRIVEPDFGHPSTAYANHMERNRPITRLDFGRLSAMLNDAGFLVRGIEFYDPTGQFHCQEGELRRRGLPARSRISDSRGNDPELRFSSLVIDAYKSETGRSPAFSGAYHKVLAVGDSHTRFLAGKDNIKDGETIPHARNYRGFSAHFDALHLGPGLAYNLDRLGSNTRILERVNTLIDSGVISAGSSVLFSFGEIDCRSHVVKQTEKQGTSIEAVVEDICSHYANFLDMMTRRGVRAMVWGPVASTPNQNYADPDAPAYGTIQQRNFAIITFNAMMKDVCSRRGLRFMSVSKNLLDPQGRTKREFYCDDIHLSQRARRFLWDILPDGFITK